MRILTSQRCRRNAGTRQKTGRLTTPALDLGRLRTPPEGVGPNAL